MRRDWSQFAADAGKAVIDIIMTDKAQDTRLAEIQVQLSKWQFLIKKISVADPGSLIRCFDPGSGVGKK